MVYYQEYLCQIQTGLCHCFSFVPYRKDCSLLAGVNKCGVSRLYLEILKNNNKFLPVSINQTLFEKKDTTLSIEGKYLV